MTLALRKKDAPIWWLFGFRYETWKPLSILGIQLAENSVSGVLSGCQGPWKAVVICCANKEFFLMFVKNNTAITKGVD